MSKACYNHPLCPSTSRRRASSTSEAEPLKPYTTFKIGGPARYFIHAASMDDFRGALVLAERHALPLFVLGGGSNILVSDRGFDGVVVHPDLPRSRNPARRCRKRDPGSERRRERGMTSCNSAVERGWWGIENLSHIPGQAGAALVQNIGAYGQQVSDVVQSAQVMEIATGEPRVLSAADCGFGYRRSIFNTTARGKLIIVGLTLRLTKHGRPAA